MRLAKFRLLSVMIELATLTMAASAYAEGPSMAFVATNPMVNPIESDSQSLSFRFSRNIDSSTGYGLWYALQTGGRVASFLMDLGVEPMDAEFNDGGGSSANFGGMLGLSLGLKIKLFAAEIAENSLIGSALFFKGMGAIHLFYIDDFGFQYGGEVGLAFAITIPEFLGIRLQIHPFASYMPYLGGCLAYEDDISQRFDVVRAGGALSIAWTQTPLLLTGAATMSGDGGALMGWAVNFGIAL